ncbi:hypothetical protein E1265_00345 [Streptomyces sp. 8K308]|uniref:hypothetical protein n=1 Tax=Streptomyces sp. 8K308 TaxID=2530388 RepID=UPI00104FC2D1|nr:hypothetical protein [Streptomyces sp. 8K308]TDC28022.1 hypothetical protein E1265_00345 [Streptomyces sp. 8K308]
MSFTPPQSTLVPGPPDMPLPEDYPTIVMEVCDLLAQYDCRFRVEGFGDPHWALDIGYDFSSVMEQLPDVLAAIRRRASAHLDFYGQGVERLLEFSFADDHVLISCESRTAWTPDPSIERIDATELETMLGDLAREFSRAAIRVDPRLADLSPFADWASGDDRESDGPAPTA